MAFLAILLSSFHPNLWHYQLQDANKDALATVPASFIVVDPDDANLTPQDLVRLHRAGKKVLAYLSIGEAEDYRDYWTGWRIGSPDFIVEENPEWKGNYIVRFWDGRWKQVVFRRADELLTLGYDGLYLDRVDVYEWWQERGEERARDRMIEFVCEISRRTKSARPGFLIIPQNAVELYEDEGYKRCIDGVGKEDTWFMDNDRRVPHELHYLRELKRDGKPVLAVDYPTRTEHVCTFYQLCSQEGFYCTISNRELNLGEPMACNR